MFCCNGFDTDGHDDLAKKPCRREPRMVHKVAELVRLCGFSYKNICHVFFGEVVRFSHFGSQVKRKQFVCIVKISSVKLFKMCFYLIGEFCESLQIMICHINYAFVSFCLIDFEIAHDLLKGKLERIAYIVEQRRKTPVFQETMSSLLFAVTSGKSVKLCKGIAIVFVGLINCQSESKYVYGMGIVISVLHQKRASVLLKLRKKLDHLPRFIVVTKEHLKEAIVDVEGIFGSTRIDKALEFPFKTESVYVHFHVVRDLSGLNGIPEKHVIFLFLQSHLFVETKVFTSFMKKTKRCGFKITGCFFVISRRLLGPQIFSVFFFVAKPHRFQCVVCHMFPSLSVG